MPDPSVISPHALLTPAEMGQADTLAAARSAARRIGSVVLPKGAGTVVAEDLIPPIPLATHASVREGCAT